MPEKRQRPSLLRALLELEKSDEASPLPAPETTPEARLVLLRGWQSERLRRTYADLLADERYHPACEFFLSDIYAARDFSQRDQDFEQLYKLLKRYLPASMLRLLQEALALNRLSHELDCKLLRALVDELGMDEELTAELYAAGYRVCNNRAARQEQIERLAVIVGEIGEGSHFPLVGLTLRLARYPAHSLGWFELYDFLERGYQAFRPMREVDKFVQVIRRREMRILDRIFEEHADPFQFAD